MRLAKIVIALAAAASLSINAAPAEAAGSLTGPCQYQPGVRTESTRAATFSSGWAVATDDTSPEILCSVQTTPQYGGTTVVLMSARGLLCYQSSCKGDYWVCFQSSCKGNGWICYQSTCTGGGSICWQSVCTAATAAAASGMTASRATRLEPTAFQYSAPPGPLFACTVVRWNRGDTVVSETFHGCQPIQQ